MSIIENQKIKILGLVGTTTGNYVSIKNVGGTIKMVHNTDKEIPLGGLIEKVSVTPTTTHIPTGKVSLYVEDSVLKGLDSGGNQISIGGAGTGDIGGSGTLTKVAYFDGETSITSSENVSIVDNVLTTKYGITMGTDNPLNLCADGEGILRGNTNNGNNTLVVRLKDLQLDNGTDDAIYKTLNLSATNNLQLNTQNVILGGIDGVNTQIPFFTNENTISNSANLRFNSLTTTLIATNISSSSLITAKNITRDGKLVVASSTSSINRIPYYEDSNNNLSNSTNLTFTSNTLNALNITRASKHVLSRNTPTNTVGQIPYYGASDINELSVSDKFKFDGNSLIVGDNTDVGNERIISIKSYVDSVNDNEIVFCNNLSNDIIIRQSYDDNPLTSNIIIGSPLTGNSDYVFDSIILGRKTKCANSNDMVRSINNEIVLASDGTLDPQSQPILKNINKSSKGEILFFGDYSNESGVGVTNHKIFEFICFTGTVINYNITVNVSCQTDTKYISSFNLRGACRCDTITGSLNILGVPIVESFVNSSNYGQACSIFFTTENSLDVILGGGTHDDTATLTVSGVFSYVQSVI